MLLAVDIGNTTSHFGLFDQERLLWSFKVKTADIKSRNTSLFDRAFDRKKSFFEGIVVGSVVPKATESLHQYLDERFSIKPLYVRGDMPLPIKLSVKTPVKVGADIIADMVAASDLYPQPTLVIDSGTATTFSLLLPGKIFSGVVITTGMELLARSLSENTALLPDISLSEPKSILGRDTVSSMQSGVYFGYIGAVKEILDQITKQFKNVYIVGTGGNMKKIAAEIPSMQVVNETLTLLGLVKIYRYNSGLAQ